MKRLNNYTTDLIPINKLVNKNIIEIETIIQKYDTKQDNQIKNEILLDISKNIKETYVNKDELLNNIKKNYVDKLELTNDFNEIKKKLNQIKGYTSNVHDYIDEKNNNL